MLVAHFDCLRAWARFRWYMEGGYKSSAGGNGHRNYTSWQEAVTGSGGLPGGSPRDMASSARRQAESPMDTALESGCTGE